MDSDKIPLHDPQSYRQLLEISQFTRDFRHISGKNNTFPDWLSRDGAGLKAGTMYNEENDSIAVAAMETIKIQGISTEALKSLQANCEEIVEIREGKHPKSFKFSTEIVNGEHLFCETSSKCGPRPFIPKSLRETIVTVYSSVTIIV